MVAVALVGATLFSCSRDPHNRRVTLAQDVAVLEIVSGATRIEIVSPGHLTEAIALRNAVGHWYILFIGDTTAFQSIRSTNKGKGLRRFAIVRGARTLLVFDYQVAQGFGLGGMVLSHAVVDKREAARVIRILGQE